MHLSWQISLGGAIGLIYAASLYFGMALSQGSTEHGGYHEALIGIGAVAGPASGALAAWYRPGQPLAAASAIGVVVFLSLAGACIAAVRARQNVPPPGLPTM